MSPPDTADSPDVQMALLVLNAVPDVLLLCRYDEENFENVVEWCNDAAEHATGLSREEIIGSKPRDLMPGPSAFDDIATRRAVFNRVRELGVYEYPSTLTFANDLKMRPLRVRATWVKPDDNRILIQAEAVTQKV